MPPEPPPDTETVRGVRSWLDRHAHRESRTRRYLELVQAVASVLTFGGVVGLLWQVQQANTTARRVSYDQVIETVSKLTQLELDHPGLACALYPDANLPFARLDREHQVALQFLILSTNAQERYWRQQRDGLLDEEVWLAQERWFQDGIVSAAMYPAVWAENRRYHAPEFVRYVDALVATEETSRARATIAAGGTPVALTLADFADNGHGTPPC
ncbi:MAG: hypothetical protein U0031_22030 [Thermomicrobiales bacterium]